MANRIRKRINKKGMSAQGMSRKTAPAPETAKESTSNEEKEVLEDTASEEDEDEVREAQAEDPSETEIEVAFSAEDSTAAVTLGGGKRITVKEPSTKKLLFFISEVQKLPSNLQTETMSVFALAYHMIESAESDSGANIPTPKEFFDFLDWLVDEDVRAIGALLACFPDLGDRIKRLTGKDSVRK